MENKRVLVVDDNKRYREALLSLNTEGVMAVGVESGEEAVKMIEKDPNQYQFAVIDHFLKGGLNGIETTKELIDRNRNLFVLVFTNVPSDNLEDIARFKYEALKAGAYRYLERGSSKNAPKQVQDFIGEMEQLTSLRNWIQDYYESREQVPSLMTQLDVGVSIMDQSHKVWFMNNAMRRITGILGQELPQIPCPMWHGYRISPCPGCYVQETFEKCKSHQWTFLSPFIHRHKQQLFYLNIWTQPIRDRKGEIILTADRKPLAVMESVQDLTGTAHLHEMSLRDRLILVGNALQQRPVDDTYISRTCFERIEIYIRGNDDTFILEAASGFQPPLKLGNPRVFSGDEFLKTAEENMKRSGYGYFFPKVGNMERVIYWPILENDRTVVVLRISGGVHCNADTVPLIRPYAAEALAAIQDSKSIKGDIVAATDFNIAEIEVKMQTIASPKEALQTLVSSACEFTSSYMPVLRYREVDYAVLLRLGLDKYGAYERNAVPWYPLSFLASSSCRTIITGQESIVLHTKDNENIQKRRSLLPTESQEILKDSDAECFEPLLWNGRCIGSLGLHSRNSECYSIEKNLQFIRAIARHAAFALHDYVVYENAQKKVENTQYETIGREFPI